MATFEKRSGGKYRVKIRLKGRGKRYVHETATFDRLTDAKRWAQKTESDIREGRYFKTVHAEEHTLDDVIDRYIEHLTLENPRRLREVLAQLQFWSKKLGDYTLAELSEPVIYEQIDWLRKQKIHHKKDTPYYAKSTVNRYKAALQAALNMAVSPWGWIEHNPAKNIKNLKEDPGRTRFLSKSGLVELLRECKASEGAYLYSIVVIALSSGARHDEVRCIKWDHVLLDEGKIILPKTKNKKQRVIHLAHQAQAEIHKLHAEKNDDDIYVFPSVNNRNKPIYFRKAWRTALTSGGS